MEDQVKNNVTPNGKSISIIRNDGTPHLSVQFDSGGELPLELSGIFTSHVEAQKAIDRYISSKTDKKGK